MEVQTQRSTVGIVVAVEVVTQKATELFTGLDVGTGVNHVTTWKRFVEGWIVTTIEFVHDHFPDRVTTGWTVVSVTVALVWHTEVQSVWPNWDTSERSSDRGIIHEELVGHHFELFVTTYAQIRGTDTNDGAVSDVGKTFDDQTSSGHFSQPIVVCSLGPVVRIVLVCQREDRNFMALAVQVLHSRVVGVFVRHEVGTTDLATVRVLPLTVEDVLVQVNVVDVDGTVKGDGDHLRHLLRFDVSRNTGTVSGTETIRQDALSGVTVGSTVRVKLNGCLGKKGYVRISGTMHGLIKTYYTRFRRTHPCNRACRYRTIPCQRIRHYRKRAYPPDRLAHRSSGWEEPFLAL